MPLDQDEGMSQPTPATAIPAILAGVAKVMISMPDELLARIDAQVSAEHATRSDFLRRLAERELARESRQRRRQVEELLGEPVHLGGDATQLLREDRESR
jgi:Arc/MetJ-type ribon-helix-helix transcriptional regulator